MTQLHLLRQWKSLLPSRLNQQDLVCCYGNVFSAMHVIIISISKHNMGNSLKILLTILNIIFTTERLTIDRAIILTRANSS